MDPATISLIITALVKYGPEVAAGLVAIYHTANATPADWEAHVFSKARKSYEDYVKPPVFADNLLTSQVLKTN